MLYQACNALIHASAYDGYSLAVHEALANSTPVIVTKNTGISDFCVNGENAIIIKHSWSRSFVENLCNSMTTVIDDAQLREHLSKNAERDFASRTWDKVAEDTEHVYEEALALR
jgi:glycosyltransferase involved in cell wall biosynthesis